MISARRITVTYHSVLIVISSQLLTQAYTESVYFNPRGPALACSVDPLGVKQISAEI